MSLNDATQGIFTGTGRGRSINKTGDVLFNIGGAVGGGAATVQIERWSELLNQWMVVSKNSDGAPAIYNISAGNPSEVLVVKEPKTGTYAINCTAFSSGTIPWSIS